jgi:hypothetical protein
MSDYNQKKKQDPIEETFEIIIENLKPVGEMLLQILVYAALGIFLLNTKMKKIGFIISLLVGGTCYLLKYKSIVFPDMHNNIIYYVTVVFIFSPILYLMIIGLKVKEDKKKFQEFFEYIKFYGIGKKTPKYIKMVKFKGDMIREKKYSNFPVIKYLVRDKYVRVKKRKYYFENMIDIADWRKQDYSTLFEYGKEFITNIDIEKIRRGFKKKYCVYIETANVKPVETFEEKLGTFIQKLYNKKPDDFEFKLIHSEELDNKVKIYFIKTNIIHSDLTDKKKLEALGQELNTKIIDVEQSEDDRKVFSIKTTNYVLPNDVEWNNKYLDTTLDKFILSLGINIDTGAVVKINFDKNAHLLIVGLTGSGKSTVQKMFVHQGISQLKKVYLFDFKDGVEFQYFDHIDEVISEYDRALVIIRNLLKEHKQRMQLFRRNRVSDFRTYNEKVQESEKLARIIIFVDELAQMTSGDSTDKAERQLMKDIKDSFEKLSEKARASGIHIIAATQRVDNTVITGRTKLNFENIISGPLNEVSSQTVLDSREAARIQVKRNGEAIKGRFLYKLGIDMEHFQSFFFKVETIEGEVKGIEGKILVEELKTHKIVQDVKDMLKKEATKDNKDAEDINKEAVKDAEFNFPSPEELMKGEDKEQ